MGKKIVKSLLVANIQEVIKNKARRHSHLFTYEHNGDSYYSIGNERIDPEKFDELFPVEFIRPALTCENPDKRTNWVENKKSY